MIKPLTPSAIDHVETLKQQLVASELKQIDVLIIAHSDSYMIDQLKEAFAGSSAVVLSIPQVHWSMADDSIHEFLDWAVDSFGVASLLLVGHSQSGAAVQDVSVCSVGEIGGGSGENRISKLFDRVSVSQKNQKQNEAHFLNALQSLQKSYASQVGTQQTELSAQGLFYRAESGIFCLWEPDTESFKALINEDHIA